MIGGQVTGGYLSDLIWSSADGETWEWIKPTGLTPRMGAAALSFNGKLWLIGGQTGLGECTNEILVSEDDGATWNPVGDEIALPENFEARAGHAVVVDDEGQIWIIGGYQATKKTIVEDGEELEREDTPIMLKDVWSGKINEVIE
jgi:N-acetylneuraminic acid mutarotase